MINKVIAKSVWLSLPNDTRMAISKAFNIPKSTVIEVCDNRVISDGHTEGDLALLTIERMQSFLQSSETDIYKLFNQLVDEIKGLKKVGVEIQKVEQKVEIKVETIIKNDAKNTEEKQTVGTAVMGGATKAKPVKSGGSKKAKSVR